MDINILIVGAGAIGSFYGGKLQSVGAKVSTLCRSDYDIVKKNGIYIKSKDGNFSFKPDEVINKINDYSKNPDYIIISTKVLPDINIEKIIKPVVRKNTSIVLIQNGIDIENPISKAFPDNNIISGLAFICVSKTSPGIVHHQDYGRLVIGTYQNPSKSKLDTLYNLFNESGLRCIIEKDIIKARWAKLIWNAPFNPISVIGGGINTEKILSSKTSINLVKNVMNDVYTLAEKAGYKLEPDVMDKNIDATKIMTPYKTSMLLDYENKRPLEVEAILGNAVRIAEKLHIKVPYLESLYSLLLLLDSENK